MIIQYTTATLHKMTSLITSSFNDLVEKTREELMSQIEREQANLLEENFAQSIKFLPPTPTCRILIAFWLQVRLFMEREYLKILTTATDVRKQKNRG